MSPWRSRCALSIAAVLLAFPASAEDPVERVGSTRSTEPGDPDDPTNVGSDADEPGSRGSARSLEAGAKAPPPQTRDTREISITGSDSNALPGAATSGPSFHAGDLHALQIDSIAELSNYTPNLEINSGFTTSDPTIFIRGIGLKEYAANARGTAALYQDGVNLNTPAVQLDQFFDLEGIDVLRGPQGSLNARNATAGAILLRSALPGGDFGVSTSLSYGNYDHKQVEAAIDVPLIEDMLSMRVSGTARWRDGYTKNQCAGWNPEKYGKPRIDQQTTTGLYESLLPAGQWVGGNVQAAKVKRQNSGFLLPAAFVFLDYDAARAAQQILAGGSIVTGTANNPTVLAEDLFDENGALVAPAGTKVGLMSSQFRITDVDAICVMQSPGSLSTLAGEANDPGNPMREEGYWQASRIQPSLSTFAGLESYTNNIDHWAARTVLLFEPLDNLEWMFNVHGSQNRGDSPHLQMLGADALEQGGFVNKLENGFSEDHAAQVARSYGRPLGEGVRKVKGVLSSDLMSTGTGGGDPFSGFYDSDGIESIDAWGINGRGVLDLGFAVISLLYDYEWYDRVVEDEGDATPLVLYPAVWSDSAWQTTEDLRVEGEGERYQWTGGFFFLHENLSVDDFFPDTQQFAIKQNFDQKLTSMAPYLAVELDLVEQDVIPGIYALTLSGGARYNYEKKEFRLASSATGTTISGIALALPGETAKTSWKEVTGEVKLSYSPFSNPYGSLLAYLSYGRGFKSGNFNTGLTIAGGDLAQAIDPVEPEFNDAVEFGIQARWFDDRLILDAAVFRYWYQNLQVFDIVNEPGKLPSEKLLNSDADLLGAEAELQVRPVPGLLVSAGLGWLDSEYEDFTVTKTIQTSRNPNPIPVKFDYSGNRLVLAPEWNLSLVSEYEIPLCGWGSLVPHYDVNYRSKVYFDPQMLDPISQDGYWLHNARIAYRTPDERIELAFWVLNLFEKEYKLDVYDQTRSRDSILEAWAEPRTYGVTLSLNW